MLSLYPFNLSITLNANGDAISVIEEVQISGGSGSVDIDPELLECYMLITRDFSDDFNDDFAR
jgi:hypothetical protein